MIMLYTDILCIFIIKTLETLVKGESCLSSACYIPAGVQAMCKQTTLHYHNAKDMLVPFQDHILLSVVIILNIFDASIKLRINDIPQRLLFSV